MNDFGATYVSCLTCTLCDRARSVVLSLWNRYDIAYSVIMGLEPIFVSLSRNTENFKWFLSTMGDSTRMCDQPLRHFIVILQNRQPPCNVE